MTTKATLSGEEIAALMSELRDNGPDQAGATGTSRPFAFGGDAVRPMEAIPALDRMNERLAKRIRTLIETFARAKPKVVAEPVSVRPFEDWRASQGEFVSLALYSLKPLKGTMMIAIQPEFVSRLVDAFYGGSGVASSTNAREFTPTEESLLQRMIDGLVGALVETWSDVVPVRAVLRSRETNVSFAGIARGDEAVAVARFTVTPLGCPPSPIEIIYPISALRSVEAELAAKSVEDASVPGGDWRERMSAAVGEVRVSARTVLARPELNLSDLMALKVGDVIPVSLPSLVPLLVEGRAVALGTIGEHEGRAALRIERIETRRSIP